MLQFLAFITVQCLSSFG